MTQIEIKVPSPGESISEVTIARWLKKDSDYVNKEEELLEIDSDKATLTMSAEQSGELKILSKDGDIVKVGAIIGKIDIDAKVPGKIESTSKNAEVKRVLNSAHSANKEQLTNEKPQASAVLATPLAKMIMKENNIIFEQIIGSGERGKITKNDVLSLMSKGFAPLTTRDKPGAPRDTERQKMTPLRKKLAQRLVAAKNQTAMLTTFNEVDMSKIFELRSKYNPIIEKKYGTKLGFMSFFTKAVCEALQLFPVVNAMIDGDDIVYQKYCDIGIAVSAPKGLVVPVLRNAEMMTLSEIELDIKRLALKARESKLTIEEMVGGTFTITNGGVFGSLMSTPIINPPQVAILGMHNVVERTVVVNGKIEIRPMMYVALSYDHRIIDGRESIGFLMKVKEMGEDPIKMLFGGKDPIEILLGL